MSAARISGRHLAVLVLLTLVWGANWPIMKIGVSHYPPLSFRALSMLLGVPLLGIALRAAGVSLRVPRAHWPELLKLTAANMLVWHVLVILAVPMLSSGRAAILGYTMPVFSAVWGAALFGQRLAPRQLAGVAAAALGVALLLWHELGRFAGAPLGVVLMLTSAAIWALGTQWMRATKIPVSTLALAFWMSVITTLVMSALAAAVEAPRWHVPDTPALAAIVYNAIGVFVFAQTAWLWLARSLTPVASTLSVMMIPVLGTVLGALWLRELLHWQDGAAMAAIVVAIASVLWPQRRPAA